MVLFNGKNRLNGVAKFVFYCCFVLSTIQLVSGTPPDVDFTSDEVEALEDFIHEVLRSSKMFESMNFDMKQRDELTLQTFSNAFRVDRAEGKMEFFSALQKIEKYRWRFARLTLCTFYIVQSVKRAPYKKRYTKTVAEQLKKGGIVEELIYTTKKFARIIDVIRHMPKTLDRAIKNAFHIELTLFLVYTEFGDQEQWKVAVQQTYALAEIGVTHQQLGELIKFCERKQEKGELTLKLLKKKLTLLRRIWQLPLMKLHLILEERRWPGDTYLESDKRKAKERREAELNKRRQLLFRIMLPLIPADVEKVFEAINRKYGQDWDIDIDIDIDFDIDTDIDNVGRNYFDLIFSIFSLLAEKYKNM